MIGCPALSPKELKLALASLNGRYALRDRALIILGVRSGLRISELLALKVGQVWNGQKVVARFYITRDATKGKHAGASIVMHPDAAEALAAWIESGCLIDGPNGYLFPSQHKAGRLGRKGAWKVLHRAFKAAGVTGSMANEIVIDQINKLGTEFNDYAELNKDSCPDIGRSAARNERMFHETNGKLVDVHRAIIRVLNDLSRVRDEPTNKTSKSEYATFFPMFCDLVYRASVLNGAQYLWDKVSYDEWYVEKIETGEKGISAIKFNLSDSRAEKAKLIGIRRQLVFRSFSKKGNAGRIAAIAMIVEAIMGTCEWHFKLKTSFNCADCERLNEGIATLLRFIGPEDDCDRRGKRLQKTLCQGSGERVCAKGRKSSTI